MISGIMYGDISDHLPIFVIAPIKQLKSVKNINDAKFILAKFSLSIHAKLFPYNLLQWFSQSYS